MIPSRVADLVFSAMLAVLGGYICLGAYGLGYLANDAPGPGFFPLWVGLAILGLSIASVTRSLRGILAPPDIPVVDALYVLFASGLTLGFIALSYVIGMLGAAFLLMLGIGLLFGTREPRFIIALVVLACAMTAGLHLLFDRLLGVPALV
ncbi:tripartite tricarboxylate transporter TctB family protein [Frigidibacter sp. MR17.24]|uniref:tripartite tricarboxylate transporter TctB family protein n=1 Tax=Frigidibacter sp. MR17.24 TaxID=3127345 RepID=UPI003012CF24